MRTSGSGEPERGGDLLAVEVEVLGGDVEGDPAVGVGHGDRALGPEERLVLAAGLPRAADLDGRDLAGVAVAQHEAAEQVAGGMDRRRAVDQRRSGSVSGSSTS